MSLYKDFYPQKPDGFLNMLSMFDLIVLFATVLSVCSWCLLGAFGKWVLDLTKNISTSIPYIPPEFKVLAFM